MRPAARTYVVSNPKEIDVTGTAIAWAATPQIEFPGSGQTVLILLRWTHLVAGITWVGLLYFFNLVNVPFMKELDAATKGKVVPVLMPRALWWFRWASVVTVLAGIWYWMMIVGSDRHNSPGAGGSAYWSFFLLW